MTDAAEKERKSSQERQELLIAELNHRVRNILGLIRGLINQGKNSTMTAEQFASVVGGRIQALARAHDQITKMNWAPGGVRTLVESEADAYLGGKADRVNFTGPDVALEPEAFATLALVVHELVTNSAKYGALSDSTGLVQIDWHLDKADQLVIEWQESGGPPVKPPTRRGFGSTIIERSIPYDLAGQSEIHYELLGVRARMVIPARFVRTDVPVAPGRSSEKKQLGGKSLFSGHVLILEDNLIIAMDAEAILERLGARRVDIASNVRDALRSIEKMRPDFALLDINLGSENSIPVALKLDELGIPFAFATGYGERAPLPPALSKVPVIQKPYLPEALVAAMPLGGREDNADSR
jgi:two-component sensor histidine kinase/CheY-like chemotaxis protein